MANMNNTKRLPFFAFSLLLLSPTIVCFIASRLQVQSETKGSIILLIIIIYFKKKQRKVQFDNLSSENDAKELTDAGSFYLV